VQPDPELYPWISVAFLTWGLLDCFLGYKVFKVTLGLLGALVGAAIGRAVGLQLDLGLGWEITCLAVGAILGGFTAFFLYLAAVFLAGFGFGATLGVLLLAQQHQMVALGVGAVLGLAGGFLAIKIQRALLILATALLGSFRAVLAASYFVSKTDWLFYFTQPQQTPALIAGEAWIFPAVLVLAVAGAVIQFESGGGKAPAKKKADKKD
jgi:hypothetical protein